MFCHTYVVGAGMVHIGGVFENTEDELSNGIRVLVFYKFAAIYSNIVEKWLIAIQALINGRINLIVN